MRFSTILILLLLVVIAVLVLYVFYVPPKVVTIVERPVYEYGVSWRPWSWGGGGWGWPGSYYVNRPMPHFYGSGGHGLPPKFGGGKPGGPGPGPGPGQK